MIERLCRSACDQARARQDREMGRHGILRNLDGACQFAGRYAFGLTLDQQPESFEPRLTGRVPPRQR